MLFFKEILFSGGPAKSDNAAFGPAINKKA